MGVVSFSEYKDVAESVKLLLDVGAEPSQSIMKIGICRSGENYA